MQEIVVMACFDDNTNKTLMNYRKDLSGILNKEMAGDWIPHITLGCYSLDDNKVQELILWIKEITCKISPINIEFNSVGTFYHSEKYPNTNVIYAAPSIPKKLYDLYCEYHSKFDEYSSSIGEDYSMIIGQPTIHSTITICDKDEYLKAIKYIWNNFKQINTEINCIKVYNMNKDLITTVDFKRRKK
ncbi:MAG: hypothetical protein IKT41_00250 [Clostridia bacterium]|nr:hypothetical protein [Clostridia bacterium]